MKAKEHYDHHLGNFTPGWQATSKRGCGRISIFSGNTTELKDEQRFLPVKNDDSRTLTCFLEYFTDRVMVYDLLYEKHDGKWVKKISVYPKLRLAPSVVANHLQENKIEVTRCELNGMVYFTGLRIL